MARKQKGSRPYFNKWIASTVAVLLFIVVFSSVPYFNVQAGVDAEAVIYFDEGISKEKIEGIEKQIKKLPNIISAKYVSADEVWEKFSKEFLDKETISQFTENPLKDSSNFQLIVKQDTDLKELQSQIQELDGVRIVNINEQRNK